MDTKTNVLAQMLITANQLQISSSVVSFSSGDNNATFTFSTLGRTVQHLHLVH